MVTGEVMREPSQLPSVDSKGGEHFAPRPILALDCYLPCPLRHDDAKWLGPRRRCCWRGGELGQVATTDRKAADRIQPSINHVEELAGGIEASVEWTHRGPGRWIGN